MTVKNVIKSTFVAALALCFASCESIYDDRSDCVNGIQLRFVFDYHMERGANAFPANVDCVTVYVFDNEGNYLTQFTESSEALMEDHYRMVLPLDEGDYRLMVYGGLSCSHPTFEITEPWKASTYSDASRSGAHHDNIIVSLPHDNWVSSNKLHDTETREGGLFYGFQYRRAGEKQWTNNSVNESRIMEVSVTSDDFGTSYTEYEVNMVKDTNNIQVILQELGSPYQVDHNDYQFYIADDNFRLDSFNNPVAADGEGANPTYHPYARANRVMGYVEAGGREGTMIEHDDSHPVQVGCVEFSTSRLTVDHFDKAKLIVKANKEHNDDGSEKTIIEIPLINYLAATQGFGQSWIKSTQEYLDRQSNWSLYFFLQNGRWLQSTVAVNDWIVRVNDIELNF